MQNDINACDFGRCSWTRPETYTERAIREQAEKDYAKAVSDFNRSSDQITLPRKPETAAERLVREAARKAYQDAARECGIFYFHKRADLQ
ncbi:hypothetical protein [Mesorhizobium sp. SP-1A]|uniref:hypothetical protein n=1 Tax=Mesorhizobium sp. SP-1A TaxID=3077840 RepID=UPI0028F70A05|nr:hypothetical protein [Mesorhizobium sp. SP-1A]